MDTVAFDWLDTIGSVLAIGLLISSFLLIAVVVWTKGKR
jgi:hypothetical protein